VPQRFPDLSKIINSKGTIVGIYQDANHVFHGFLRDRDGAITSFDPPGSIATVITGMNEKGKTIGNYAEGYYQHGFLRSPDGNYTDFDPPQALQTFPSGINRRGDITGDYDIDYSTVYAFVRDRDGKITIFNGPCAGVSTFPASINDAGVIGGEYLGCGAHGFVRDRDGNLTTFDAPGSTRTSPRAMNSRSITGCYDVASRLEHGFLLSFAPDEEESQPRAEDEQ